MKILLLTKLFPSVLDKKQENVTHALYDFVKYWVNNHEIFVIRPFIFSPKTVKTYKFNKISNIINSIKIKDIKLYNFLKIGKFLEILEAEKFKPDIIISHMAHSLIIGHYLAKNFKIPFIVGIHNTDLVILDSKNLLIKIWFWFIRREIKKALFNCNGIACRSIPIKNKLIAINPELKNKCFVVNSGIDENFILDKTVFIKKVQEFRKNKKINFITVAGLVRLKNIDINLQALAKLTDIDWNYTIIGDGPEKNNLKNLTQKLKIENQVNFLGYKDKKEILEILKNTHIFLMISAPETFGLAYLEAMARGNIIIGTKNYGIDGIIINENNGFLCTPRNSDNLLNTINNIININIQSLESITLKNYETIQNLSEETVAQNYLNEIIKIQENFY